MSEPVAAETRRRELPMQVRLASFQPATFVEEARTVEVVWSTGVKVRRYDWWEDRHYHEELSLDPEHVRLDRLNAGAPLLKDHRQNLDNVIGKVERAWLANGEARAVLRFASDDEAERVMQKVRDGILPNLSVGYTVRKYEVIKEEGQIDVYRAVDWEPAELSFVAIPADPAAQVRSRDEESRTTECEFINRAQPAAHNQGDAIMAEPTEKPAENPGIEREQVRKEAAVAERTRVSEIITLCKRHAMDALAAELIDGGVSIDKARAAILDRLAEADEASPTVPRVETVSDETDNRRAAVENALLHRAAPSRHKLDDSARQFRGMSLLEIARDLLESAGVRTRGLSKLDLAQRAMHGTSDFPLILANVANKTLRAAYEAAPRTFVPFCRQASASDFKEIQRTQVGDAPQLKKVNEHGEFTYGTVGEGAEKYQLATYGRIVAITRQAIINDDMGAFTDMPAKFGRAAADLESDVVWGIVTSNAAMSDTVALFHADHGNLAGTAAALDIAPIGIGRAAMRGQKSIDGRHINVTPRYLLVPAALETKAQQFTSQAYVSAKSSDINPFAGALMPIAEPRLDAASTTAWYLAADPAQIDTIEYCYLDGNEGVYLETRTGFEVDGMEIKARLDFAAKAIDWRGLFKNAGQ